MNLKHIDKAGECNSNFLSCIMKDNRQILSKEAPHYEPLCAICSTHVKNMSGLIQFKRKHAYCVQMKCIAELSVSKRSRDKGSTVT